MVSRGIFPWFISLLFIQVSAQNYKRDSSGASYARFVKNPSARLNSFVLDTVNVSKIDECSLHCINNQDCFSVNFGKSNDGMHLCELINIDRFNQPSNFVPDEGYDHYNIKTPCMANTCKHGLACLPIYSRDDYQCTCPPGYTGSSCEIDINECASSPCSNGTCNNLVNRYTCTCEYGYAGVNCDSVLKGYLVSYPAASCMDVLYTTPGTPSGAYYITTEGGGNEKTYCHMEYIAGCGSGGWTMVMKIDGTQNTFGFHSALWSNKNDHNHINGSQTGLNSLETKLPSYWSTPFNTVCLGMTVSGITRWMSLWYPADSLYALIADGQYRETSLEAAAWKNLVGSGSLQYNCRYQGFNTALGGVQGARIGIVGNNEIWCTEGNSWLGFGGLDGPSCGNKAEWWADNGDRYTPTFCYILIQ